MIKTFLTISVIALGLSACVANDGPATEKEEIIHKNDHYQDGHTRQYNGYPYDRNHRRSGVSVGVGVGSNSGTSVGVGVGTNSGIGFGYGTNRRGSGSSIGIGLGF